MELSDVQTLGKRAGESLKILHKVKADVREMTPLRHYSQSELTAMLKSTNRPISRNTLSDEMAKMEDSGYEFVRTKADNFSLTQEDCIAVAEHLGVEKYRMRTDGKAYVVIVQNLKGGVGKSLSTGLVATALTNIPKYILADIRVLIIDLDPQGTSTQQHKPTHSLDEGDYTSVVLMCGDTDIEEIKQYAIKKTENRNVDIICCGTDDGFYADEIDDPDVCGKYKYPELLLERVIKKVENDYDVILLDAGPHMDKVMKNCIWASHGVFIPVPPTFYNFDSTLRFIKRLPVVVEQLAEDGMDMSRLDFIKSYLTKVPTNRGAYDNEVYESASSDLNDIFTHNHTIKHELPLEDVYERCAEMGRTIFTMKAKDYPGSNPAFNRAKESAERWAGEIIDVIMYHHKQRGAK